MPGYSASHRCTPEAPAAESKIQELALQFNSSIVIPSNGGHVKKNQNSRHLGVFKQYISSTGAGDQTIPANHISGDLSPLKGYVEARTSPNGDQRHISQCQDFETSASCNEIHEEPLEGIIMEAREGCNALQSHHKDVENLDNVVCELTASHDELKRGFPSESWDEEIIVMSSVQQWVESLAPEIGYESDSSLQYCSEKCAIGCEKHAASCRRSPLHHHFGYKSPSELFEKVIFSEDEQIKARTDSNSTASSSSSSANNACQGSDAGATCTQVHTPSSQGSCANSPNSKREAQSPLARLLKRGLKQGDQSVGNLKMKGVVVNGHVLSNAAVKRAEERAGKLRPGSYWYDCKAGFWGVEGGPCLGILPPCIDDLSLHPMARSCSNGDTQVYVNGRELHTTDLAVLARRGLLEDACKAYALGFDGVLVDETTGLEIKHLGKLAPTVERQGKGFGMFAANAIQNKTATAKGNC